MTPGRGLRANAAQLGALVALTFLLGGMIGQERTVAPLLAEEAFGVGAFTAILLLGAGTALAYPTLLAAVGDVAGTRWRASALGVYRLWRDLGFAAGALILGLMADLSGPEVAIWGAAAFTALSGLVAKRRMRQPVAATPWGAR